MDSVLTVCAEVQVVEAQLADADSSTGNKSNKSPPHD
jgi:hypothetical protein